MRTWHSLYEILKFPIGILFLAYTLLGIGNLLANPAYAVFYTISNDLVLLMAEALYRMGTFLIVNFPLFFLIRIVTRKSGSATTVLSAISGFGAYLIMTMYFSAGNTSLPATAFSSILGLSFTTSTVSSVTSGAHYPLQTGLLATLLISLVTFWAYNRSRHSSEYGLFSFVSREVQAVLRAVILSAIIGFLVALIWPYVLKVLNNLIDFIASDTTNPMNLAIYGVSERTLGVLNLGALIRQPFWYSANGGSWVNLVGNNITGDVSIWTAQLAASSLNGISGRFITPYYVLNLFAIPGLLWAFYSLQTDLIEKRRMRFFYILATLLSLLTGTLLPMELILLFLCPLLFLFHVGYTGILFGVFQALQVYLGYNYTGSSTITALPGTLLEFLSYLQNPEMYHTLIVIAITGVISSLIYFLVTRLYFKRLALDLFNTGGQERMIAGTIAAAGGIDNIKMTHSSVSRLVISLYDPLMLDVSKLNELGSIRVFETKAGFAICYGASSTIVSRGIMKALREKIRDTR